MLSTSEAEGVNGLPVPTNMVSAASEYQLRFDPEAVKVGIVWPTQIGFGFEATGGLAIELMVTVTGNEAADVHPD